MTVTLRDTVVRWAAAALLLVSPLPSGCSGDSGWCGNGAIDDQEECDEGALGFETCEGLGYYGGELSCGTDCRYDLAGCQAAGRCGDDTVNGDEACDGTAMDGQSCETLGYNGGQLVCTEGCALDLADCEAHGRCGDGDVQPPEECEDGNEVDWDGCTACRISEFTVDTSGGFNSCPDVAATPSGDMVVVWHSAHPDDADRALLGQRLDTLGGKLGAEFTVELADQSWDEIGCPALAVRADGSFLVAWTYIGAARSGVFVRRFSADGVAAGAALRVDGDSSITFNPESVGIAESDGTALVVWSDRRFFAPASDTSAIYGRLLDADGAPTGEPWALAAIDGLDQTDPAVVAEAAGTFAVVWARSLGVDADEIVARRFEASGAPSGAEFAVSGATAERRAAPRVCAAPAGGTAVVWANDFFAADAGGPVFSHGISARFFDAAGAPTSDLIRADPATGERAAAPDAIGTATGRILLSWTSGAAAGESDTLVRLYDPFGVALTAPEPAGTNRNRKTGSAAAADPLGHFFAVWGNCAEMGCAMGGDIAAQRIDDNGRRRGALPW